MVADRARMSLEWLLSERGTSVEGPVGATLAGDVIRVTIARHGLRAKTGDWAVTRSGLTTPGVWRRSRVLLNARNTQCRHVLDLGCIRCICAGGDVWRLGAVSMRGCYTHLRRGTVEHGQQRRHSRRRIGVRRVLTARSAG